MLVNLTVFSSSNFFQTFIEASQPTFLVGTPSVVGRFRAVQFGFPTKWAPKVSNRFVYGRSFAAAWTLLKLLFFYLNLISLS